MRKVLHREGHYLVAPLTVDPDWQFTHFWTALKSLRQLASVAHVEVDPVIEISRVPEGEQALLDGEQWGLLNLASNGPDIDADAAWDIAHDAPSVIVAVIDTGIQAQHADLRDGLWINDGEAPNGLDDDGNGIIDDVHGADFVAGHGDPADGNGHGTHVAGIIGASGHNGRGVTGVCWSVRLMTLKALNDNGAGLASDAADAVGYAVRHGAHIINASFGTDEHSELLRTALREASEEGVIIVAAAGNDGFKLDRRPVYPAAYSLPNLLSVAASDRADELAPFSGPSLTCRRSHPSGKQEGPS